MQPQSRREFIKTAVAGAGLLISASSCATRTESNRTGRAPASATDRVTLGRTGIKATRLAQGTGFNGYSRSSAHTRMGKEKFDALLRHSLDQGINFIDMADLYGSHPFVKDVIKGLPRDKFVLLSKIWPRQETWVTPSGGAKEELERFRKEVGVERIDICLIHCMMETDWPQKFERIRDELSALKQQGVVRAVGVSCHDFGALKVAAAHPWTDVILARINYRGGKDYAMDAAVEAVAPVLQSARANGKTVLGMKVFGAGKLVQPQEKDASLKYVFSNNLVDAVTIGMLSPEEVNDTIARLNQALRA